MGKECYQSLVKNSLIVLATGIRFQDLPVQLACTLILRSSCMNKSILSSSLFFYNEDKFSEFFEFNNPSK